MWGVVKTLGLEEGLNEFKEQFNKDAKATIANQQWAKDRGIDVAKLDEWEKDLQQSSADLSKRTIGAAVDVLAKDETLAHLLEIGPMPKDDIDPYEDESDIDWDDDDELSLSSGPSVNRRPTVHSDLRAVREPLDRDRSINPPVAVVPVPPASATTASEEKPRGAAIAEEPEAKRVAASDTAEAAGGLATTVPEAASKAASDRATPSPGGDTATADLRVAPPSSAADSQPQAEAPAMRVAASMRNQAPRGPTRSERVRQLEAELSTVLGQCASLESQLATARANSAELEARWSEISAVSDDALRQAEEARQEVLQLRASLEEKDAHLQALEAQHQEATSERSRLETVRTELEGQMEEKVKQEVSLREQELLQEVDYLRKANEAKERRISGLAEEKANLEKRALGREADTHADREVMMAAHTAIAKAFGDISAGSPALRLVDEPLLKFTAVLFKQPMVRRVFFAVTTLMWASALVNAVSPGTGHHIVV
mmetsp:Transcript_44635/g.105865  ORF Transcript_44635/g.105865 Transcript_44635/m.105865 type:complete len:487 (+) Transcript_44635:63-1523(+)